MPTAPQPRPAAKQPYERPIASFVPLKVEERLMVCAKVLPPPVGCNIRPSAS